jgi:hypothetical protein
LDKYEYIAIAYVTQAVVPVLLPRYGSFLVSVAVYNS